MNSVYITQSTSASPLGLTEAEIISSIISGESKLKKISNPLITENLSVALSGYIPGSEQLEPSDVQLFKENLIKNLLDQLVLKEIDCVIFSNNSGPNFLTKFDKDENFLNSKFTLNAEDFLKPLSESKSLLSGCSILSVSNTCSSGTAAMNLAKNFIRIKKYNVILIINYELTNHIPYNYINFFSLGVLNTKAQSLENYHGPFSEKRSGMVKSDAISIAVVQSESSVNKIKSQPIAEIIDGFTVSECESLTDFSSSSLSPVYKSLKKLFEDAKINLSDIGFVSPHGTGTYSNDLCEIEILNNLFQGQKNTYISSLKAQTGHSLSAASLLEIDVLMKIFKSKLIPAHWRTKNSNLLKTDALVFAEQTRLNHKIDYALKISSGFGGYNSALILKNLT